MSERIQKVLATAGVASRREIERLIGEGAITVNGRPATVGQKIDETDQIKINGRAIAVAAGSDPIRVLLYKKRVGEIVTRDDPEGRRTVFRKLPKLSGGRWIAVGRLDLNTSGLLLFTNDGELARRLTHPSFEIPRVYAVRVLGTVDTTVMQKLTSGVELEDGVGRFVRMEPGDNEDGEGANQWYRVVVREGRNRFVRRMIESQDLQVSRLIRTAYGPLELGRGIKSGSAREAEPEEMLALLDAVGMKDESHAGKRRGAKRDVARRPDRDPDDDADRRSERGPARVPTRRARRERASEARKPDSRRDESRRPDARSADPKRADARTAERRAPVRSNEAKRKTPSTRRPEGRAAAVIAARAAKPITGPGAPRKPGSAPKKPRR